MHLRPSRTLGKTFDKLFDLLNEVLKRDHISVFNIDRNAELRFFPSSHEF